MEPTLHAGDRLFIVYGKRPRIGDLVVAAFPDGVRAVKRITEKRDTGWWLSSDNPEHGTDSRHRGPLANERIRAVVVARVWPRPRPFVAGR
jgi:phage repressor protein C with HTH and peptisase S24 domain